MKVNVYSGETKLSDAPLSVEEASKLAAHLVLQGVPNIWLEALRDKPRQKRAKSL